MDREVVLSLVCEAQSDIAEALIALKERDLGYTRDALKDAATLLKLLERKIAECDDKE